MDDAVLANLRKASDRDVRMHDGSCADPRALGHRREGADAGIGRDRGAGLDVREAVHARRRTPLVGEQRDRAGERQVRIVGAKHRAGSVGDSRRGNDGRRLRLPQPFQVLAVGEEGQVAGRRMVERGDTVDFDVAVPLERTGEPGGNVAQLHVDTALRSKKLTRCSSLRIS